MSHVFPVHWLGHTHKKSEAPCSIQVPPHLHGLFMHIDAAPISIVKQNISFSFECEDMRISGYEGRDYQPYLTTNRFEHKRLRCKYVKETFTLKIGGSLNQMVVWLKRGLIISQLFVSYTNLIKFLRISAIICYYGDNIRIKFFFYLVSILFLQYYYRKSLPDSKGYVENQWRI